MELDTNQEVIQKMVNSGMASAPYPASDPSALMRLKERVAPDDDATIAHKAEMRKCVIKMVCLAERTTK